MVEKTARVMKSAILIGIVVTNAIVLLDHIACDQPCGRRVHCR
jgi:multidrug efflux pump subunit AcrB